jgi:hypothetical protein
VIGLNLSGEFGLLTSALHLIALQICGWAFPCVEDMELRILHTSGSKLVAAKAGLVESKPAVMSKVAPNLPKASQGDSQPCLSLFPTAQFEVLGVT